MAQELLASRIPAWLAYVWPDGRARVASLWFHWDGTDSVMATLPGAPKLKHRSGPATHRSRGVASRDNGTSFGSWGPTRHLRLNVTVLVER